MIYLWVWKCYICMYELDFGSISLWSIILVLIINYKFIDEMFIVYLVIVEIWSGKK